MKKYLLLFIGTLAILKASAQDTIHSIAYSGSQKSTLNFENRNHSNYFYRDTTQINNLWQFGTPSKKIFKSAYSTPIALVTDTLNSYPNENKSSFEFVIRTDDYTLISFWHRFDTDSLADGGVIEVSKDGGYSWVNIINSPEFILSNFYKSSNTISSNAKKPAFTGTSPWTESTIQGNALNYVRFRFTFTSDGINTQKEGWMIDNFKMQCIGTAVSEKTVNSFFYIFPNPTTQFISVQSDNSERIKNVSIIDVLGKKILTTEQTTIDLSQFDSGLYFVEISTEQHNFIYRIQRQ